MWRKDNLDKILTDEENEDREDAVDPGDHPTEVGKPQTEERETAGHGGKR